MLRIGSVGTSAIMRVVQEAISLTKGLECTVIFSRDAARGRAFAAEVGVEESCDRYEEMLASEDVDIVYVASPNAFHVPQALAAIERGKHVIVEKPLATTRGEAEALFSAARRHGVFAFEAITTLFMPNYRRCRQLLPQLGRVRAAEIRYSQRSSKYDAYLRGENPSIFDPAMRAGALNDMGVYGVHAAVDLFGAPRSLIYAPKLGRNGIDLAGEMTLHYPDFDCKIVTAKDEALGSFLRVEGENGWIYEEGPLNDFGSCRSEIGGEPVAVNELHHNNRMVYEMARFRDAILARDHDFFEHAARQSAEVSAILEAAHRPTDKR